MGAPGGPVPVHIGGETLVERLMPHVRKLAVGVVVLAVVLTIAFAFRWHAQQTHEETTENLASALTIGQRPIREEPPAPDPKAAVPAAPKPGYVSVKARATAELADLSTHQVETSALYRASLELTAEQLDASIADYRTAGSVAGLDGVLAREGLGIALETKATADKNPATRQKGLEDALAAFVAMQPDDAGLRRDYALYHQGRLLKLLGKSAEARTAFTKAKQLAKEPRQDALSIDDKGRPAPLENLGELIDRQLAELGES